MAKTVTLRLEDDVYEELREEQFADDDEMTEILGDEVLIDSLEVGSKEARSREGRFVG